MVQAQLKAHWLFSTVPTAKTVICITVTLALWGRPAAYVDIADSWPLAKWLSGFGKSVYDLHGTVVAAPYLAITQIVSNALVRVIVPEAWQC